jgi:hypothetical protein
MVKKDSDIVKASTGPIRQDRLSDVSGIIRRGNAYFMERDATERPYTVGGFCSAAGITREQLLKYGVAKEREKASRKMKNKTLTEYLEDVRLKIMANLEERCLDKNAVGAIFLLKSNYGYDDGSRRDQEKGNGGGSIGELTINIKTVK